jgi:hypothetical protein
MAGSLLDRLETRAEPRDILYSAAMIAPTRHLQK